MPTTTMPAGAVDRRLTPEELRELRDTFEMRGLMPVEQARLLAHVAALERELQARRPMQPAGSR